MTLVYGGTAFVPDAGEFGEKRASASFPGTDDGHPSPRRLGRRRKTAFMFWDKGHVSRVSSPEDCAGLTKAGLCGLAGCLPWGPGTGDALAGRVTEPEWAGSIPSWYLVVRDEPDVPRWSPEVDGPEVEPSEGENRKCLGSQSDLT